MPIATAMLLSLLALILHAASAADPQAATELPGTPPLEKQCAPVRACVAAMKNYTECPWLPVPARSALAPIAPNSVELLPQRPGVWVYRDLAYLSLIVRHERHLVLVDFPDAASGTNKEGGSGTRLTDQALVVLNGTTPTRIDMVYSHGHYDHIGAGTRFHDWATAQFPDAEFRIWGTLATSRLIEESTSKRAPLPTQLVRRCGATLALRPGLALEMRPVGGHQGDDLAVHIAPGPAPGDKGVLMHVDVVFPRWSPFSNFAFSEEVGTFVSSHDELLRYDFDVFVGGHLRLGSRADVVEAREYARDILEAARLAAPNTPPEAFGRAGAAKFGDMSQPQFGDIWFRFVDAGRKVTARTCARMLIAKWGCRLGGMSATESHCFVAITYLQIED